MKRIHVSRRLCMIAATSVVVAAVAIGGAFFYLGRPEPHKPLHHVLPVAAATPTPTPRVPPMLKAAVTTAAAGTPVAFTASGLTPGGLGVFAGQGDLAGICRANAIGSCLFDYTSSFPAPMTLEVTDVASALESQSVTVTYTGNYTGPNTVPQSGPGAGLAWGKGPSPTLTVASATATVGSRDAYTIGNVVPGLTYFIVPGKVVMDGPPVGAFCSPTSGSHTCSGTLTSTAAAVETYYVSAGIGESTAKATAVVVHWTSPSPTVGG